jgi:hypothetical protein
MASLSGQVNYQPLTSLGALAAGYRLYTYLPGTTTHTNVYTDAAGSVAHTYTSDGSGGQYIALDARGEVPGNLYLNSGGVDLNLKTTAGVTVWTKRAIGQSDLASTLDTALRADLAASSGATLLGFIQAGAGATARTGQSKMRDTVSVKDFGALGDGSNDDTAEIQAAIDAAVNAGRSEVWFPGGDYKISAPLTVTAGTRGLTLRGEYYKSRLIATHAGAILSFPSGTTTQFTVIDRLHFRASGTGAGAATGIVGDAALAYVMLIDVRHCIFSGSLRRGVDGNFLMAFFTRNSFGSDQTPAGGNTYQAMRLRASDSFMSTLLLDSNQFNSSNDTSAVELDWGYSVTFRGKNDFEGNVTTDCVVKSTDILGLNFDDGWGENNGAVPFVKLYDGSHATDPRVSFNNWHYEGVGSGANDTLIDTQEAAGGLYSIKNSVIQDLTHISRSDSGYDVGAQCLALENNKVSGVTPVFIETPSWKGTVTNDNAIAGSIGEYVSATQSSLTNFPATTAYGDGASIALTAGDWDISLQGDAVLNGATMTGTAIFGISSTSGNSASGLVNGDNAIQTAAPTATANGTGSIANFRVKLTGATTYYAKVRADYSAGNPQYRLRISARRVR